MRRLLPFAFLATLAVLWLYPEWFGLVQGESHSSSGAPIKVRDGDTIAIGTQDYRLSGIDAPEFNQSCKDEKAADWPCGKQAKAELSSLVSGHELACEELAHDKYQRIVATCRDEDGRDLARTMIERGLAVSFGGFAEGPYATEEADAKRGKRGVWQGSFDPPSSWRSTHPSHHVIPKQS